MNGINIAPCKGCDHRAAGCHGKCREYQAWKTVRQMHSEKLQRIAEANDYEARNVYRREGQG